MSRQIVVDVVGDASGFSKATKDATTSAGHLDDKLKGLGKGMVLGAGIGAFNLLNDAVSMGIGKLGEAAQAFRDDQVSATQLAGALERNIPAWAGTTAAVEAYASAQGRLAFSDDEVRASLGQLVGVTHDQTTAMELNTLAQDLARAKNIDLATATDLVTKAHEGNGRGLKALGIDIEGAVTGADFLAAAERNVKGAAEEWAATNEGKLAVSNTKVGEAMEKVGAIVDRVSSVVIPAVSAAFVGLVEFFDAELAPHLKTIQVFVETRLAPAFGKLTDAVAGTLSTIGEAITEAKRLLGIKAPTEVDERPGHGGAPGVFDKWGDIFGGIGDFLSPNRPLLSDDPFKGLPGFAAGGTVPGALGAPMLAVVHGGERITPNGGGTINIYVTAHDTAGIMQELRREVTRQGMSLGPA